MWMRTLVALTSILAFGTGHGWADAYKAPKHHRHPHMAPIPGGGRLRRHL